MLAVERSPASCGVQLPRSQGMLCLHLWWMDEDLGCSAGTWFLGVETCLIPRSCCWSQQQKPGLSVRVSKSPQGVGRQRIKAGVNYSPWKALYQQKKTHHCLERSLGRCLSSGCVLWEEIHTRSALSVIHPIPCLSSGCIFWSRDSPYHWETNGRAKPFLRCHLDVELFRAAFFH